MKNTLYLLIVITLVACGKSAESVDMNDVTSLRAAIKKHKSSIAELEGQIKEYEDQIQVLAPAKETVILVSTDTLKLGNFDSYAKLQGNVVSSDIVNVTSEMGGRLTSIKVEEGQPVNRGQLVATVDMSSLEKQIDEVNTALDLAKTVYERQKRLWDQEIGSEIQYLQAKNNKERLEKSLQTMQTNLSKRNIYAPISGVVDREFQKAGEVAIPGAPIFTILNTNRLKVVADVPETYLSTVKRGSKVDVYFPAIDQSVTKKISMVGRSIDPSNRTFKIEVPISNRGGLVKPNLLAEVEINDVSKQDVVTIPVDIIQEEIDGQKYIYIIEDKKGESRARKIHIETGDSYQGNIVVTKGLKGNEVIVIAGGRALTEGTLVKLS